MKHIKWLLCFLLILTGCSSSPKESTKLKILCPSGAPSLALTNIYDEHEVTIVDGTDLLIAELSKENSDYDIIIAPINLGAKLISTKQTDYRLESILTWGNLYLVGESEESLNQIGEIALFGNGAVPEKIYNNSNIQTTLTPNYYNAGNLVQSQLLLQKVKVGLLAEPLASATILKAKEEGIELNIIKDLQEEYAKVKGFEYGYPQAAIFIKDYKKVSKVLQKIEDYSRSGFEGIEKYIDAIGVETLKLPNANITLQSLPKQNINYKKAKDCIEDIQLLLQEFNITFETSMMINE